MRAELKNVFRAQGVATAEGARAYVVTASASDGTNPGHKTYVDVWTGAQFGVMGGEDDAVTTELSEDAQDLLGALSSEWRTAHR